MDELSAWVENPLSFEVDRIDMDNRRIVADETIRQMILDKTGTKNLTKRLFYKAPSSARHTSGSHGSFHLRPSTKLLLILYQTSTDFILFPGLKMLDFVHLSNRKLILLRAPAEFDARSNRLW